MLKYPNRTLDWRRARCCSFACPALTSPTPGSFCCTRPLSCPALSSQFLISPVAGRACITGAPAPPAKHTPRIPHAHKKYTPWTSWAQRRPPLGCPAQMEGVCPDFITSSFKVPISRHSHRATECRPIWQQQLSPRTRHESSTAWADHLKHSKLRGPTVRQPKAVSAAGSSVIQVQRMHSSPTGACPHRGVRLHCTPAAPSGSQASTPHVPCPTPNPRAPVPPHPAAHSSAGPSLSNRTQTRQ